MTKLEHYNASIQWEDKNSMDEGETKAVVTLPDATTQTIERRQRRSDWQATNGVFSTGETYYLLGDSRFETFDDLMQRGLGLTKET